MMWTVERFNAVTFDGPRHGWSKVSQHPTRREAEATATALRAPKKHRPQSEQTSFRVRPCLAQP